MLNRKREMAVPGGQAETWNERVVREDGGIYASIVEYSNHA